MHVFPRLKHLATCFLPRCVFLQVLLQVCFCRGRSGGCSLDVVVREGGGASLGRHATGEAEVCMTRCTVGELWYILEFHIILAYVANNLCMGADVSVPCEAETASVQLGSPATGGRCISGRLMCSGLSSLLKCLRGGDDKSAGLRATASGQAVQSGVVLVHTRRWRFLCSARWSEREKLRSQSGHWNGLTPVCFRKCLVSSSERANFHVQPSHMHL